MMDLGTIEQIIAQYAKHGWELRRVLYLESPPPASPRFGDAEFVRAQLEALWFSRSSRPETTAWELRHLGDTPYALVTAVPEGAAPDETDEILEETEKRMLEALQTRSGTPHQAN